jgi:eukaryotic-like serine/threonine-protein kinase
MPTDHLIQNRYQIVGTLGEGGMGIVYKAYDRLDKHYVALKQVLLPTYDLMFASKVETEDTEKLRLSLAQEFSILATLRHPHILNVLDYGFDEQGHPYYTMTLLDKAADFRTYALQQTTERKYRLLVQLLQAVHYLHRRNILHRDLKPANVLVTPQGQVKVMDFGLAKVTVQNARDSARVETGGTLLYMSPELVQGEQASVASDLWAVGIMAYEILLGRSPFSRDSVVRLLTEIMTQAIDFGGLSAEASEWLVRLLDKDPGQRPASAYDAMLALYKVRQLPIPEDDQAIRESFLQASTFVGRDAELTQLTDALQVIDAQNAFFLVGGESGVGKSRLLDELRIRALINKITVLRGQAVEGGGLTFQVWRPIVRRLLLMVKVTDLQAGTLKDLVPDVSELLDRDVPDAPELTGRAYQERMTLTIVDLLRTVERPLLLLLEDLQWAGQSLAPLQQILQVQKQLSALMVVANYRDDESPGLPDALNSMTHLKLERLDATAIKALSAAMLGSAGADKTVTQMLEKQSEGNAFFIIETVRALAEESGHLEQIGRATLPPNVFTGGMQTVMRRRLNKVDAQHHAIQTLAAVIGREIDAQLLEHRYNRASIDAWLNNAAEYGVVDVQDNTWRFAHDKLRETVIADVTAEAKPTLHYAAAEAIEAVYPDDATYHEPLLRHWREAGDLDKELSYLDPVARQMIDIQGTYAVAQDLLEHLLQRLPEDDPRRVMPLNWVANLHRRRGQYADARSSAERARQLAERTQDDSGLANALNNLGMVAFEQGDYDRAGDLYQPALAIRQQINDKRGIATSLNNLGTIAYYRGDQVRAVELYEQSLAIRQEIGDQRDMAGNLHNLGIIAHGQGMTERAIELYEQSLAIRRQIGDQNGTALSLHHLGMIAHDKGDYDRATDLHQQSLAIYERLGGRRGIAAGLYHLGMVAHDQGDYDRAIALYVPALALEHELGNPHGIASSLHYLGVIVAEQGNVDLARDFFQQSLTIARQVEDQALQSESLCYRAWVAFDRGDADAPRYFAQGLSIAHAAEILYLQLFNIAGFAAVLQQQGKLERAAELLGLVQQHPIVNPDVQKRRQAVMHQLETKLAHEDLQAALQRGTQLELGAVVANLLATYSDDTTHGTRRAEVSAVELETVIAKALALSNARDQSDRG